VTADADRYHHRMLCRRILALWFVPLLATLAACETPLELDMKAFCAIVHEVKADKELEPPTVVNKVQKRAKAELKDPGFTALYATISAAEADARYELLMKAAEAEGMHMWTCIDGRNMWKDLGEHERMAAFDAEQAKLNGGPAVAAKTDKKPKKAAKKKKKKRKKKR